MFILKGVKVLCFDTLLEVLILKGVKVAQVVLFCVLILKRLTMAKSSEKITGLKTRHYSRRRHPDALGKNSGRMEEGCPGLLGLGIGGGAGCEVGCGASGGAGCEVDCRIGCGVCAGREAGFGFGWGVGCEAAGGGGGGAA